MAVGGVVLKGSPAVSCRSSLDLCGLWDFPVGAPGSQLSQLAALQLLSHPRSCLLGRWLQCAS